MRTSVEKQENVVSILWHFAENLQKSPDKGCVATNERGVRVSLDHVQDALQRIMDNFGYATARID